MPDVTGDLREITGASMEGKKPVVLFTLNRPNLIGTGPTASRLLTTEPLAVKPAADGKFTAVLQDTHTMLDDAFYSMQIRWLGADASATLIDFPDWEIRVPTSGGPLSELATGPGGAPGGTNNRLVYVSLVPPPKARPFTYWLHSDPNDPGNTNRQSSGNLYELRNI